MNPFIKYILIVFSLITFACHAKAQVNDICADSGNLPSLDSPFAHIPYVYGKINLVGFDPGAKLPYVIIIMAESSQNTNRLRVDKSGNYCFKVRGSGGTLIVELDGIEVARRTLPTLANAQQREDFEISPAQKSAPPSVVSAKFSHPVNPKTIELYKKTVESESKKDSQKTIDYLKEIVSIDPEDFIALAKLGLLYQEKNLFTEAEVAFRKSLELKIEYTPAWINIGMMRVSQKQFEAAIEIFKHAIELDPTSARAFQLLGEAYLQAKKGTLGAEALNQAIKLDPIGMVECHLQLAHLYQLAGAKQMATKEYKIFLTKIPNYADKKKLEKFIKENPE